MRVAALYDIHGNMPALEAVLAEVRASHIDAIVVGGDTIPGPMPAEVVSTLCALEMPSYFIQGNCEVAALTVMAGGDPVKLPERAREGVRWSTRHLPQGAEQLFA